MRIVILTVAIMTIRVVSQYLKIELEPMWMFPILFAYVVAIACDMAEAGQRNTKEK